MVTIKVAQFDSRLLKRAREVLGDVTNAEIFRYIPNVYFRDKILAYLKAITPRGKRLEENMQRTGLPAAAYGYQYRHTGDLWRAKRSYMGNRMLLEVTNLLETVGGKRGKAKLYSMEYGNRALVLKAKKTFTFRGRHGWVTIGKHQTYNRSARQPLNMIKRTVRYIEDELMPYMQLQAEDKLRSRLERHS